MSLQEGILILDFGSQYTQLIARKIRELKHYTEIHPYHTDIAQIKALQPAGIILSGGPSSVYAQNAPDVSAEIFQLGIPILGICYGLQLMAHKLGGKVEESQKREYGKAKLKIKKSSSAFLKKIDNESVVWMSHGDKLTTLPKDFSILASTSSSKFAVIADKKKKFYGVQFHPEVQHSQKGKKILKNFCSGICNLKARWTMENFARVKIKEIQKLVGKEKVLLGLSGGVDSMVTAKLLHEAIGDQLTCVYVDNGLMRLGESEAVKEQFQAFFKIHLETVAAGERFLQALKDVTNPEEKRKIIGRLFVEEFKSKALQIGHHEFLAQGTLYTDVIESVSVKGPSQTIKSHHNRVDEILQMIEAGKVIEPLKELFKDEVRKLGLSLGIPKHLIYRHPFPGPGLAVRTLGAIDENKLRLLRLADAILIEELKIKKFYNKTWQAFAVFLPVQSVGVMGDKRTYENVIAIRVIESLDGMTADFAHLPHKFLGHVANRIINEIQGINRVVYDISSKPPATIEWE